MPCTPRNRFSKAQRAGGRLPATVKANQRTFHRQIQRQFEGKRQMPFLATDPELSHGRGMTWIVGVITTGQRDGKSLNACHLFFTNIRTTAEALLQLVRDR
jgi:hypothetical protein